MHKYSNFCEPAQALYTCCLRQISTVEYLRFHLGNLHSPNPTIPCGVGAWVSLVPAPCEKFAQQLPGAEPGRGMAAFGAAHGSDLIAHSRPHGVRGARAMVCACCRPCGHLQSCKEFVSCALPWPTAHVQQPLPDTDPSQPYIKAPTFSPPSLPSLAVAFRPEPSFCLLNQTTDSKHSASC